MIDTVVFTLENLRENNDKLYSWLVNNYDGKVGYSVRSPFTLLEREVVFRERDADVREKFRIPNIILPSSNYKLQVYVDLDGNKIDFDFSLPKLFYGHNVGQLVSDPFHDLAFTYRKGEVDKLSFQLKKLYKVFKYHIRKYLANQFPFTKVDVTDLLLNRIDICYNQYFATKQDALKYLEQQKLVKPKFMRDNSTKHVPYGTSIHYNTTDYSFKIYHKGEEFIKNDSAKLNKHNKSLPMDSKIDVQFLQDNADRILRYEYMFRSAYLSKLYNRHVFRKNSKDWNFCLEVFQKCNYLKSNGYLSPSAKPALELVRSILKTEIYTTFGPQNFLRFVMLYYLKKRWRANKEYTLAEGVLGLQYFHDQISSLLDKSRKFYLKLNKYDYGEYAGDRSTNNNFLETWEKVELDSDIFDLMGMKFQEFISYYQLEKRDTFDVFKEKLALFNEKMSKAKAVQIASYKKKDYREKDTQKYLALFIALQGTTLKQYAKRVGLTKSTYRRYKKHLKDLGFNDNSLDVKIKPPLDYLEYWSQIDRYKSKMFCMSFSYFHKDFEGL